MGFQCLYSEIILACAKIKNFGAEAGVKTVKIVSMKRVYFLVLAVLTFNEASAQFEEKSGEPIAYRKEYAKNWDLIHTKLEVQFEWEKKRMKGIAQLLVTPYFYGQTEIVLDAKGMDVNEISSGGKHDNFTYDGNQLVISLKTRMESNDTLEIRIDYLAKPYEREIHKGKAIADDRGLYFINADGADPDKPMQIWTQGETESNSVWCPTIDAPNERATHEISLTVAERFMTLSNGLLISQKANEDGTRTDHWQMDQPHAPYLMMMTIGEFVTTKDQWNEVALSYHLEKGYGDYGKDIFEHTPEMMDLFSELLQYPFPWKKYDQVVVRDFVTGAMENTTASVFMEQLNVTDRELMDERWDYIIAHELFHQWFGDLVTSESWANLTLNEGFASYSEYLWNQHKFGQDEADYQFLIEKETYLAEAKETPKSLIRYYYEDESELYDAHTYNKGALVLHMLRSYLGDKAFFRGLNVYLTDNAFQAVELAHLRMAFEKVVGQDLHWFFDQWYFFEGHPEIEVKHEYKKGVLTVTVLQKQTQKGTPAFELPVFIDIYKGNEYFSHPVVIKDVVEEFEFPMDEKPNLVLFDSEHQLLAEMIHQKSDEELVFQMLHEKSLVSRVETLDSLQSFKKKSLIDQILKAAFSDPHYIVRQYALEYLIDNSIALDKYKSQVLPLLQDSNSEVRTYALTYLSEQNFRKHKPQIEAAFEDESYMVLGTAITLFAKNKAMLKQPLIDSLKKESNISVVLALGVYFNAHREINSKEWFEQQLQTLRKEDLFYFMQVYAEKLLLASEKERKEAIPYLKQTAQNNAFYLVRFSAVQVLMLNADLPKVNSIIQETIAMETDERLLEYYKDL